MKLCPLVFALSFLTGTGVASANVIVVDAGGGGSFLDIQSAVTAAADGDTILVKPGSYSGFTIDNKALTVIGEAGVVLPQTGPVDIKNLVSGKTTTLSRVNAAGSGTLASDAIAFEVTACEGNVRVTACTFTGRGADASPTSGVGASVTDCDNVAFTGCTFAGGHGWSEHTCHFDFVTTGSHGLLMKNSEVAVSECISDGGQGGNGGDAVGKGGAGISFGQPSNSARPGFVAISRSNLHGGPGGYTDCADTCEGKGGDGLHMSFVPVPPLDTVAWILDAMVVGGAAGGYVNVPPRSCGDATGDQFTSGIPFMFSASSLGFSIPAIAREGDFVAVTFTGVPGTHVFLNDELTTTFTAQASWRGVLVSPFPDTSGGPMRARRWGVIPASGILNQVYRVPALPPSVQAQTRFLQAYRIGPNGLTLGTFRTLTVVDSSL